MKSYSVPMCRQNYNVYCTKIAVNKIVEVYKEHNAVSLLSGSYCCKIDLRKIYQIGPVTVGDVPTEITRFVYFFTFSYKEDGDGESYGCRGKNLLNP